MTARFESAPTSHDGSSAFTLELQFSETLPAGGARGKVERSLVVTGGTVTKVRRVDRRRDLYRIWVRPAGNGAVTVTLSATYDCEERDAICTSDDRALAVGISASLPGPASQTREVSIAAANPNTRSVTPASNSVTEGAAAVFTLTRTGIAGGCADGECECDRDRGRCWRVPRPPP